MLSACGGGGVDEIPTPALRMNDMFGDWANTDPSCIQLGPQSSYQVTGVSLYWSEFAKVYKLYDNPTCTALNVGGIIDIYTADWSASTAALAKSGTARIKLSNVDRVTFDTLPSPTLALETDTVLTLFYVQNNQLSIFKSNNSADLDSDGYPLGTSAPSEIYAK